MPMPKDDRPRCKATAKNTGKPCKNVPMRGQTVCRLHGGATRHSRAAAQRRLAQADAAKQLARLRGEEGVEPLGSPSEELLRCLGEMVHLKNLLQERLAEADGGDDTTKLGTLQAYATALERTQRAITDWERLGLQERVVALREADTHRVVHAVARTLRDHGVDADERDVRDTLKRHLSRLREDPEDPGALEASRGRDDGGPSHVAEVLRAAYRLEGRIPDVLRRYDGDVDAQAEAVWNLVRGALQEATERYHDERERVA